MKIAMRVFVLMALLAIGSVGAQTFAGPAPQPGPGQPENPGQLTQTL